MNTWIVVISLAILAGCQSKPTEQALGERPSPVVAVRGDATPSDSSANPLVNTVRQGVTTMDKAQEAAAKLNAQTAQQQRAADANP